MGRRAGGSGVWVLIAFAAIGYWVYGEVQRKNERTARAMVEAGEGERPVAPAIEPEPIMPSEPEPAIAPGERALEIDDKGPRPALGPERAPASVDAPPRVAIATDGAGCLLSSGPFALPDGTKSVDWKVINRADHDVDVEVTVYQLRIGETAKVVAPGAIRKTLPSGHETHNANSVGPGKPFPPGSDFEVVVRRSGRGALPSLSFWSTHGNTEIPGTRIGPRDFVAISGDCSHD